MKLLLVEDDVEISDMLIKYLGTEGFEVVAAYDGESACKKFFEDEYVLVLLDLMIPKKSGMEVMNIIREKSMVPIIIVSAKDTDSDKSLGLGLGADDYVTKPFSLPVLYAKSMALTGRIQGKTSFLEAGTLKVDVKSHKVWKQGKILGLPPKEYDMLVFFLENPGRIYSREQLLIRFWGYDFDGNERVVDNHIKKLRKAMGSCGCSIQTVPKSGYRLEVEE